VQCGLGSCWRREGRGGAAKKRESRRRGLLRGGRPRGAAAAAAGPQQPRAHAAARLAVDLRRHQQPVGAQPQAHDRRELAGRVHGAMPLLAVAAGAAAGGAGGGGRRRRAAEGLETVPKVLEAIGVGIPGAGVRRVDDVQKHGAAARAAGARVQRPGRARREGRQQHLVQIVSKGHDVDVGEGARKGAGGLAGAGRAGRAAAPADAGGGGAQDVVHRRGVAGGGLADVGGRVAGVQVRRQRRRRERQQA